MMASLLNRVNERLNEEDETEESYSVVLHADYITGYTLIEVKVNSSEIKYAYDENPMYYVEKDVNNNYGSYCYIIEGTTTVEDVESKLTETDTVAGTIDKSTFLGRYDVNSDDVYDVSDVLFVLDIASITVSPIDNMSQTLKADINSNYSVSSTENESQEIVNCYTNSVITITPNTTEPTNDNVTATIEYADYLSMQLVTKKAGFGTTLEEAKENATVNATSLTATSNGYFYAVAEDSEGTKIEKSYQVTNINP